MNVSPRLATTLKGLACVLFVGHMAATCTQQIPAQSALRPLATPFYRYEELTGIWQSWNMFTTIPYLHKYGVELEVLQPDGTKETTGVMLPGLRDYDGTLRAESFLTCVLEDPSCALYVAGYVANICSELRARAGHGGQKVVFREAYERLRVLPDMRLNGVIAKRDEHRSPAYDCGD
jgi:hypothetical protein